ncbi:MAG: hypothetical protein B6244_10100 [Candidatus Cloacimonetes bacterium 4572_55]|nr:MAG: hypothetical protein B6244_10100 [Candidatus Cloacimonetes bacterium 4572_55]
MKILIIEDDFIFLKLISKIIENNGHEPIAYTNAEDALERYQAEFFPLIVTDVGLPGIDGLELCRRVRAQPQGQYTAILVVTGTLKPEDLEIILDAGADDYIGKPFHTKMLKIRLKISVQRARNQILKKEADEALKSKESELLLLKKSVETMQLGIAISDVDRKIIYVNQAIADMHGYRTEELLGQNVQNFAPRELWGDVTQDQMRTFGRWNRESVNLRKDGHEFPVQLISTVIKDEKDEIVGVVTACEDITERKKKEDQLRASRERFKNIFQSTTVSLWDTDFSRVMQRVRALPVSGADDLKEYLDKNPDAVIRLAKEIKIWDVNQVTLQFYEADSKDQLLGSFKKIFSSHSCCIFKKVLVEMASGSDIFETEIEGKTLKGRRMTLLMSVRIPKKSKDFSHILVSETDITYLKQTERELVRAKDMAESANQAKSAFLSSMSHEIRTPLNSVLGFSQILHNKTRNKVYREYLKSIEISGKTLLKLLNDILDLAGIESGKLKSKPVLSNLRLVMEEVKHAFLLKLMQKDVDFILDLPDDLPKEVHIDERRLRQVLLNLVGNAVKFTEKGHVKLSVRVVPHKLHKHIIDLIISVEDTGIGIEPEIQESIFDAFQQYRQKYEGAGLGLTIVKQWVELMNGSVRVESQPDIGSVFELELKGVKAPGRVLDSYGTSSGLDYRRIVFNTSTILIADDVKSNRMLIKAILKCSRAKIFESQGGEDAVELAERIEPTLILMDLQMSKMDSYNTVERIRTNPELEDVPIIALIVNASEKNRKHAISSGFNGCIKKPIQIRELFVNLMGHLDVSFY